MLCCSRSVDSNHYNSAYLSWIIAQRAKVILLFLIHRRYKAGVIISYPKVTCVVHCHTYRIQEVVRLFLLIGTFHKLIER